MEDISQFLWPTNTSVVASGNNTSEFQSQSGQPYLHLAEDVCDTCNQANQPSQTRPHTCHQTLVGLETGTYRATGERSVI